MNLATKQILFEVTRILVFFLPIGLAVQDLIQPHIALFISLGMMVLYLFIVFIFPSIVFRSKSIQTKINLLNAFVFICIAGFGMILMRDIKYDVLLTPTLLLVATFGLKFIFRKIPWIHLVALFIVQLGISLLFADDEFIPSIIGTILSEIVLVCLFGYWWVRKGYMPAENNF